MREVWRLYRRGTAVLSAHGRRVLHLYGLGLSLLALLDGAALYFVSTIFTSNSDGDSIAIDSGGSTLVVVLVLFTLRTLISTVISWISVRQLALEEVRIGSENFDELMKRNWHQRIDTSVTDLYNGVDRGPNSLVQGLLINVVTIISEATSATVILSALLLLQPATALIAAIYFVLVAVVQHKLLSRSSSRAGESVVKNTNGVYEVLTDAFSLAKLLTVSPSLSLDRHLEAQRRSLALARGRVVFLGMLPRYFMELILAIGLAVIAGVTYVISGIESAVSSVTVFAAAGFRLLPIVNRIQGLILQLFSTVPSAHLALIDQQDADEPIPHTSADSGEVLVLKNVSYRYPSSENNVLSNINLALQPGFQYAVVGQSGAGKTTLVDLCLGLLTPQDGEIVTAGQPIAYVPQETHIARMSLEQNIALEWDDNRVDKPRVQSAIRNAQLADLASDRHGQSEMTGNNLSGGQKQRVGLARAFYRNPSVLFLDEVTSALDAETEHAIMSSIEALRGSITVVIVAHRLSTVQHADQVIFMDRGEIKGVGTFDELRRSIPQLQRQIELGSLNLLD